VPLQIDAEKLRGRFADNVLSALIDEELLTQEIVDNIKSWPHSGFSAFLGEPIAASDTKQRLFVARYLKKCPISNERLSLSTQGGETTVSLRAGRDGKTSVRTFSVLEFLAELPQHLPDVWEQTSRFFGIYSFRSRGAEKEKPHPFTAPYLPDPSTKPSQKWAALMSHLRKAGEKAGRCVLRPSAATHRQPSDGLLAQQQVQPPATTPNLGSPTA
jgi:hypothetical protein